MARFWQLNKKNMWIYGIFENSYYIVQVFVNNKKLNIFAN